MAPIMLFDLPLYQTRKIRHFLGSLLLKPVPQDWHPTTHARPGYLSKTSTLDSDHTLVSSGSSDDGDDLVQPRKHFKHDPLGSTFSLSGNDMGKHKYDCCILEVERVAFTVPKFILCRDRSAFVKMLRHDRTSTPIRLSDTAEQFRDLLQVLYAFPSTLPQLDIDSGSITKLPRLLNVAELAQKYTFSSIELWAAQHIQLIVSDKSFYLPTQGFRLSLGDKTVDADELSSRILLTAIRGHHTGLLDILVQKLMSHILWHDYTPGRYITRVLDRHSRGNPSLRRLQGVLDYRTLVNLPIIIPEGAGHTQPIFPPSLCIEQRMRLLAAHHILTAIWDRLCKHPPPVSPTLEHNGLPDPHAHCSQGWAKAWFSAAHLVSRPGVNCEPYLPASTKNDAAILGKLKQMMLILRQQVGESRTICMECSMGGLEALSNLRDEVIQSLDDMFVYC